MRAGLIIGGVFVMLIAAFCFFTIILLPLAILFGLVGFIMLIVGLFTSAHKQYPIHITQQVTTPTHMAIPTAPSSASEVLAICPKCNARIPTKSKFCPDCGADIVTAPAREVLAICPKCKARVPSGARFCSECGADLRPKRKKS